MHKLVFNRYVNNSAGDYDDFGTNVCHMSSARFASAKTTTVDSLFPNATISISKAARELLPSLAFQSRQVIIMLLFVSSQQQQKQPAESLHTMDILFIAHRPPTESIFPAQHPQLFVPNVYRFFLCCVVLCPQQQHYTPALDWGARLVVIGHSVHSRRGCRCARPLGRNFQVPAG